VLVTHDLLGLFDRFMPKFVRKYADLHTEMQNAFTAYIADVQGRAFPAQEHIVEMPDEEWESLVHNLTR
jgi:3-methyl-2-oxobutanoate hydroxymethyltransferase